MKLEISAYSHHGGKSKNQDYFAIFDDETIVEQAPFHQTIETEKIAFALSDGISAFRNSHVASQKCIQKLMKLGINNFTQWVKESNQEVIKLRSGCTLIAAKIVNDIFEFVNVGDSLLYYIRDGKIYQLAQLHTLAYLKQLQNIDIIEESDYHTLIRYIGDPKNEFDGYSKKVRLQANDRIIICSDGLSDVMSEDEILNTNHSAIDYIRTVKKQTSDNVTVIVIDVIE